MQSATVNGYQPLYDPQTVSKQHRGTAALFLFYSLSYFSSFSFYMFVTLTVLFLFLGASIVCVNNIKRTADLVLCFPDKTSVCTHPWQQNDLLVFIHYAVVWLGSEPGTSQHLNYLTTVPINNTS